VTFPPGSRARGVEALVHRVLVGTEGLSHRTIPHCCWDFCGQTAGNIDATSRHSAHGFACTKP
jgi:hypothetical protein